MNYRLPHLASLQDIEQWADRTSSRSQLANLLRRLVKENVKLVTELSMPGDEDSDLGGYDGLVTSPQATPLVPLGKSVWEFGTNGDPGAKANLDYNKRTKDSLGVDKLSTTFVFVTPRRWPGSVAWVAKKAEAHEWAKVVVVTASDLFSALESAPNTHIWFSELLKIPAQGVMTLAGWWEKFTSPTKGLLTAELLMAGREQQGNALLRRIVEEERGHTWIGAPSTDDVLGFVAATIQTSEPGSREALMERTLVVLDPGALAFLDRTDGLLILLPYEESLVRQADLTTNHHVILHMAESGTPWMQLPALPISETTKALENEGVDREKSREYARALGKSVEQFRARVSGAQSSILMAQASTHLSSTVYRRSWMLGAWNGNVPGDIEAFESIVGSPLHDSITELLGLSLGPAPAFTRVGESWKVSDIRESFLALGPTVSRSELQSFERIVQDVLGAVDPRLDVPRGDRWRANIDGLSRAHSSDLRKGVARTLAIFSSDPLLANDRDTSSLKAWTELTVRALLERANADSSGKLWESLLDVMSLLAEAAPDMFLNAIDVATRPDGVLADKLFSESEGGLFSQTSPHTYLLWALERLAWSPLYFSAVSQQLLRLTELDPGGKTVNRPSASLTNLLRPWLPQTAAKLKSRMAILRKVTTKRTQASWDLLMALMPDRHAWAMDTSGPEFQAWKNEAQASPVTVSELIEFISLVLEIALDVAREKPHRFVDLIGKWDELAPDLREKVVHMLESLELELVPEADRSAIWSEITALVRKHREFADADWSLPEEDVDELERVGERFLPDSVQAQVAWLFERMPELGEIKYIEDHALYEAELGRQRTAAIKRVFEVGGFAGIVSLAEAVEDPWSLGFVTQSIPDVRPDVSEVVAMMGSDSTKLVEFATSLARRELAGDTTTLIEQAQAQQSDPVVAARILRLGDDLERIWEAIPGMGAAVEGLYWAEFNIYGRGSFDLANETAARLASHGRIAVALDLLALYSPKEDKTTDASLVFRLLGEFVTSSDPEARVLSQYDLTGLLALVRNSGDFSTEQVAALEWSYLAGLDSGSDIVTIQQYLADSPATFAEMISYAYRRKSGQSENDAATSPALSSNAWNLLRRWKVIPGSTGEKADVDPVALETWITETRLLLTESDRLNPGEAHIGEVFAHSKVDPDGTWPTRAVRDFLEADDSIVIRRNFVMGITNSRGVTSRALDEGGDKERVLAQRYAAYAEAVVDEWPRTAQMLRQVEAHYLSEAKENDIEAEREGQGFEY